MYVSMEVYVLAAGVGQQMTGAVGSGCQRLERLECILCGCAHQCVITSENQDRLSDK